MQWEKTGGYARVLICAPFFWSILVAPALARKTPAALTPTFHDRANPGPIDERKLPACAINFVEIADNRTSPLLAGVVDQRAVQAPLETGVWLRAVLKGLNARGVRPLYDGDLSSEPKVPSVKFGLMIAWIAQSVGGYNGNVVVNLKSPGTDGTEIVKVYRGRVTRTDYWSSGDDRMQSTMDGAFESALDLMAVDLKKMCPAQTPATSH
jgi:hypothetical protein